MRTLFGLAQVMYLTFYIVALYFDGTPSMETDLAKLSVNDFAGVEFYTGSSSIPMQFNRRNTSCGVLVLWTRER